MNESAPPPASEIASARVFGDDVEHWKIRVGALCRERDELLAKIAELEEENRGLQRLLRENMWLPQ